MHIYDDLNHGDRNIYYEVDDKKLQSEKIHQIYSTEQHITKPSLKCHVVFCMILLIITNTATFSATYFVVKDTYLKQVILCTDEKANNISEGGYCMQKDKLNRISACSCRVTHPTDCDDLQETSCESGIYKIFPQHSDGFDVYCEFETDGEAWTVFQRRSNGQTDFYRDWLSYKKGFGNPNEEFWLGNENIHKLTTQGDYILRIDLEDFENNTRYAEYETFKVDGEDMFYNLTIKGYQGNAENAMRNHNGQKFSTTDRDNDADESNCARSYKGGWWYAACHTANLNGLYLWGNHSSYANGINWWPWRGFHYSLMKTTMKIRRA